MIINNDVAKKLKKDFPIFKNNPKLIYLDNGATTQKPNRVINTIKEFYEKYNANVARGFYKQSQIAMEQYQNARRIVAKFINAEAEEIIFTHNATDSINSVAYAIESIIPEGRDEIVLTEMEHHSNLIPWQQLAFRSGFKLKFIKIKDDFTLDLQDAQEKITKKTAIVSLTHVSNSLGTINPVEEIVKIAKSLGVLTLIDATQSVPHMKVDVGKIGSDFLVFSGHKMLGPTGVGVLYGKRELLEKMQPFNFGGGMIKSVSKESSEFADLPEKFEAGTPNIAGAVALAEAITYIDKIGVDNIHRWESELMKYLIESLKKVGDIVLYNVGLKNTSGILSFNIKGIHAHDVASILDSYDVAVRAGHHCCMPLMKRLGIPGTVRASFYFYNTYEDIDKFVEAVKKTKEKFGR
ncbi:cysteine desulfurase [Candidatus Pacearchaeota archaeon]|nr:cysteine desulfurase [Candidatus Pacearchaeota archaeon]